MSRPNAAPLTLSGVAAQPALATEVLQVPDLGPCLFRPLAPEDIDSLAEFLSSLSPETRRVWLLPAYNRTTAQEFCAAIGRFDKFRMVLVAPAGGANTLLALLEFAFHPDPERRRFASYGAAWPDAVCKFGPCIRDGFQNRQLGSLLMPHLVLLARRFGAQAMVLWGGVLADNHCAIHFYEKHGFETVGRFASEAGVASLDMALQLQPAPTQTSRA
ncbi:MAG: GNAT family N-acetyltransferase [Planctomycetota bacterium]